MVISCQLIAIVYSSRIIDVVLLANFYTMMDRFLKRPAPTSTDSSPPRCTLSPASKKPKTSDKQGNVSVSFRAKEFGPDFYESGGKLFCRPCNMVIEHHRKSTVTKHVNSKVCYFENLLVLLYLIFSELLLLNGRLRYTYSVHICAINRSY